MILNHDNIELKKISKKSLTDKRHDYLSLSVYFLYTFSVSHLLPLILAYVIII